jgi:subtilase family serine protease
VEVDPAHKIQEADETNNTVTMQVKPTKRHDIAVTDNRCTVGS